LHEMQPPYESQLSGHRVFIVQNANKEPEPPFPGGLHGGAIAGLGAHGRMVA